MTEESFSVEENNQDTNCRTTADSPDNTTRATLVVGGVVSDIEKEDLEMKDESRRPQQKDGNEGPQEQEQAAQQEQKQMNHEISNISIDEEDEKPSYEHGLEAGDHVIRWSMLALWPIQIHGIVLSVGPGIVTLVDFGFTSSRTGGNKKNEEKEEDDQKIQESQSQECNTNDEAVMKEWEKRQPKDSKRFTIVTLITEKEIKKWNKVNYGENAIMNKGKIQKLLSWFSKKKKPKSDSDVSDPKNNNDNDDDDVSDEGSEYISLKDAMAEAAIDEEEIKNNDSKKVATRTASSAGVRSPPASAFAKLPSNDDQQQEQLETDSSADEDNTDGKSKTKTDNQIMKKGNPSVGVNNDESNTTIHSSESSASSQKLKGDADDDTTSTTCQNNKKKGLFSSWGRHPSSNVSATEEDNGSMKEDDNTNKQKQSPKEEQTKENQDEAQEVLKLPKSDPAGIVLERVRFILEHENSDSKNGKKGGGGVLPPYHLFDANSECIAVWCKTGRFSNLQAAVFLHSTALGQVKSATCLSLFVASQTVTVTSVVPASGIMGWFGVTTTTSAQVGLLSTQPWLIPLLAGYGIAAIGTPYFLLINAQKKWKKATKKLNDEFWSSADPSVFVEAIHCWSGLR